MSFKYSARMLKYLLVLVSVQLFNVVDGDAVGGIFRYGHIRWSSTQNTVNFVVEAAFQRSVKNSYFVGTAPDGFAQEGDVITLFGREAPIFDFGDLSIVRMLKLTVTAYSVQEDWIFGEISLTHKYSSPSNNGLPWIAQLQGCCRLSTLANNQNARYLLTAEVFSLREMIRTRILYQTDS
mmetsp:Transcript_19246/g.53265  ORF Transcript_19246/g.53265 Transcript_19246/m.53265 type:complete len:180 (+) Transcript_19246:88-627(+)